MNLMMLFVTAHVRLVGNWRYPLVAMLFLSSTLDVKTGFKVLKTF